MGMQLILFKKHLLKVEVDIDIGLKFYSGMKFGSLDLDSYHV